MPLHLIKIFSVRSKFAMISQLTPFPLYVTWAKVVDSNFPLKYMAIPGLQMNMLYYRRVLFQAHPHHWKYTRFSWKMLWTGPRWRGSFNLCRVFILSVFHGDLDPLQCLGDSTCLNRAGTAQGCDTCGETKVHADVSTLDNIMPRQKHTKLGRECSTGTVYITHTMEDSCGEKIQSSY